MEAAPRPVRADLPKLNLPSLENKPANGPSKANLPPLRDPIPKLAPRLAKLKPPPDFKKGSDLPNIVPPPNP